MTGRSEAPAGVPQRSVAIIEYADASVATTRFGLGAARLATMTDDAILELWNDTIAAGDEHRRATEYVATEIPVGKLEVEYFEAGRQWTPRGDVLRCQLLSDAAVEPSLDEPFVRWVRTSRMRPRLRPCRRVIACCTDPSVKYLPRVVGIVALAALLPSCTFFVRLAAGPSLGTDGSHGGVVTLAVGGGIGTTRATALAPSYEQAFGVGSRHGPLDRTVGVALLGYGSFGESARFGLGGHIGLLLGRDPDAYRGHAGGSFPFGIEFRMNSAPGFSTDRRAYEEDVSAGLERRPRRPRRAPHRRACVRDVVLD